MALTDDAIVESRFVASEATPRDLARAVVVDRVRNGAQWLRRCLLFLSMSGVVWIVSPGGVSPQRRLVVSAGIGLLAVTAGAVADLTSLHRRVRRWAEREMPADFEMTGRFGADDYTIGTATGQVTHPYQAVTHVAVRPTHVAIATWRSTAVAALPLPRALFPDAALDRVLRGVGGPMPAAEGLLVDAYDHVYTARSGTASRVARAHLRSPAALIMLQFVGTAIFVIELLYLGRRFSGVVSVIVALLVAVVGAAVLAGIGLIAGTRNMRTDLFDGARLGTRFDEDAFVATTPTTTLRRSYEDVRSIEPHRDLVTLQFHGSRRRIILPRALFPDDAVEQVRGRAGLDTSGGTGGRLGAQRLRPSRSAAPPEDQPDPRNVIEP